MKSLFPSKKAKENPTKEYCLDLYERVTPEDSPPASSAFISKCGPIVTSVWSSYFVEANQITNDINETLEDLMRNLKLVHLKGLKEYFQRIKK